MVYIQPNTKGFNHTLDIASMCSLRQNICRYVAAVIRDIDEPARRARGWALLRVASREFTSKSEFSKTILVISMILSWQAVLVYPRSQPSFNCSESFVECFATIFFGRSLIHGTFLLHWESFFFENPPKPDEPTASCSGNVYAKRSYSFTLRTCVLKHRKTCFENGRT